MIKKASLIVFAFLFSSSAFAEFTCEVYCVELDTVFVTNGIGGKEFTHVAHQEALAAEGMTRLEAFNNAVSECQRKGYNNVFKDYTTKALIQPYFGIKWSHLLKTYTEATPRNSCYNN